MKTTEYTYPSFTETMGDLDKLGFLGHGVDLDIPKEERSTLLGRKVSGSGTGPDLYVRKDQYGYRYLTIFTNNAGSRVYRYEIQESSKNDFRVRTANPDYDPENWQSDKNRYVGSFATITEAYQKAVEHCW